MDRKYYTRTETLLNLAFYTEGPVIDSKDNIYFTTLKGGCIFKLEYSGTLTEWAFSMCPNGQIIVNNEDHLICDSQLAAIRRYNAEGKFIGTQISGSCGNRPIHCPNDIISDNQGNIYFTDSIRYNGKIFFLGINGKQGLVAENIDYPNGLALSNDESVLYVAESYQNRILLVNLDAPGIAKKEDFSFFNLPVHLSGRIEDNLPDGLKVDAEGNIWVAHYGMHALQKLSREGKLIDTINVDMPLVSNLYMSGSGMLLITGGFGEPGPGAVMEIFY